jgi:hypothetical protein
VRTRPPRLNRPRDDKLYRVRCACGRWPRGDSGWFETKWEADEAHAAHADRRSGHHPRGFETRPKPQELSVGAAPADPVADEPATCLSCGVTVGRELTFLGSLRCLECRAAGRPLDPTLTASWLGRGASF